MNRKENSNRLDDAEIGTIVEIDDKEYVVRKIEDTVSKKCNGRQIRLEPFRVIEMEEGGAEK